MVRIKAEMA